MRVLVIYTDGAARGNPGPSASGYRIYENKKLVARHVIYNGIKTNNYAEYNAIVLSLKWCIKNSDLSETWIKLFSDSMLVIKQLNGEYKIKSGNLRNLYKKAISLAEKFSKKEFRHVPRKNKGISDVDKELNLFLDRHKDKSKTKQKA